MTKRHQLNEQLDTKEISELNEESMKTKSIKKSVALNELNVLNQF